jgi:hypothetical protein
MARHAHRRRLSKSIAEVAFGARHILVFVMQRESCLVMIELHLLPGLCVMTGHAVLAQLAFVRLLGLVAGNAVARGFAKLPSRLMTNVAGNYRMGAAQREVGCFVIERLATEFHDVRAAALMFYVTGATLSGVDAGHVAMEALLDPYVRGDLLVTVETQLALATAIASVMTGGALLLVLLVSSG